MKAFLYETIPPKNIAWKIHYFKSYKMLNLQIIPFAEIQVDHHIAIE